MTKVDIIITDSVDNINNTDIYNAPLPEDTKRRETLKTRKIQMNAKTKPLKRDVRQINMS